MLLGKIKKIDEREIKSHLDVFSPIENYFLYTVFVSMKDGLLICLSVSHAINLHLHGFCISDFEFPIINECLKLFLILYCIGKGGDELNCCVLLLKKNKLKSGRSGMIVIGLRLC